jgi:hypothetical protein
VAGSPRRSRRLAGAAIALTAQAGVCCGPALADESGASAWLPGQFASFVAVPGDPGFALETIYYHRSASASAGRTFSIGGRITAGIDLTEQYVYLTPSYTFAEPVLHGQLFVGVTFAPGRMDTSVQATLTGPGGNSLSGNQSDSMGGIGDIYPLAMLKWNVGSHNFMAYLMPSIPAGAYDPNRIAGLGIGHWSLDGGLGYTYLNDAGFEVSVTAGLTHNFMNPSTLYQSGMDAHIDWGASYSLTEEFYLGAAGYFYNQVGADSGPGARLGAFQSKVAAVGPQVGYGFAVGAVRVDLNLRGYKEFAAENRPEGWNVWVTLGFSAARPKNGKAPP